MNELYHHGVKGMHWGVRRYQNADGTLTAAGKKRYNVDADNLQGYSKLANSKIATKMRKRRTYSTDLEIARINREKANIKNAMRELDDVDKAASKNGVANGNLGKASRMAERAKLMRQDKDVDYRLQKANERRDQLSSMQKNADRFKADSTKPLNKTQKKEMRKARINRAIDSQTKAVSSASVNAGMNFAINSVTNRLLKPYGGGTSSRRAAVDGFITGYSHSAVSQLYDKAGIIKR